MKLTILLLFLTVAGYAQREIIGSGISVSTLENKQDPNLLTITNCVTLQDYIKAYEADCYTEVLDTIKRCGTVKYEYIPVYENEVLLHYKAVPVDTIWKTPNTKKYKHETYNIISYGDITSIVTPSISTHYDVYITNQEPEVCVDYIYTTLKRKVYPFSEDFWNFVKNYKQ